MHLRHCLHTAFEACEDGFMDVDAAGPTPPLSPASTAALARAEAACAAAGETLTPVRRRVLELLLTANAPVKAYDLLALLKPEKAPPNRPRCIARWNSSPVWASFTKSNATTPSSPAGSKPVMAPKSF